MPLTRSLKRQILITMNGVKFLMADGATEVPCRASRELLEDRFGSNGDQAEDEKAFREHRAAIEQAASNKYDAGEVEPVVDPKNYRDRLGYGFPSQPQNVDCQNHIEDGAPSDEATTSRASAQQGRT
jgi:hypothetical protein